MELDLTRSCWSREISRLSGLQTLVPLFQVHDTQDMVLRNIAVGIDRSSASGDALLWAHGWSQEVGASIKALSAWRLPLVASLPHAIGGLPSQAFMAKQCADVLNTSLAQAGIADTVESLVHHGKPGVVMAEASGLYDLVVLGRTGTGRKGGSRLVETLIGSTARHAINHAEGPIALVPEGRQWEQDPRVVVGVDGSAASVTALRWALENVPAGSSVVAVRAVPAYLDSLAVFDPEVLDLISERAAHEVEDVIAAATTGLGEDLVGEITSLVVVGDPRVVLREQGRSADLLVVGERGKGATAAFFLGSVSEYATRHVECAVVVVPDSSPRHRSDSDEG